MTRTSRRDSALRPPQEDDAWSASGHLRVATVQRFHARQESVGETGACYIHSGGPPAEQAVAASLRRWQWIALSMTCLGLGLAIATIRWWSDWPTLPDPIPIDVSTLLLVSAFGIGWAGVTRLPIASVGGVLVPRNLAPVQTLLARYGMRPFPGEGDEVLRPEDVRKAEAALDTIDVHQDMDPAKADAAIRAVLAWVDAIKTVRAYQGPDENTFVTTVTAHALRLAEMNARCADTENDAATALDALQAQNPTTR